MTSHSVFIASHPATDKVYIGMWDDHSGVDLKSGFAYSLAQHKRGDPSRGAGIAKMVEAAGGAFEELMFATVHAGLTPFAAKRVRNELRMVYAIASVTPPSAYPPITGSAAEKKQEKEAYAAAKKRGAAMAAADAYAAYCEGAYDEAAVRKYAEVMFGGFTGMKMPPAMKLMMSATTPLQFESNLALVAQQ